MLNNRKGRQIKDILILFLIIFILVSQIPNFSYTHQFLGIQNHNQNETQHYFETEASLALRLKLQDKIKFGVHIKRAAGGVFYTREGYNESFLDSLPIIRDNIPDFLPERCQNDTTVYISKTKVSVIMNYHNELLSLLLRSVYSLIAAIPPHNFQELILIDDGSNLTSHQVYHFNCWMKFNYIISL